MANIVDSDHTAPIGAVLSGSTLFASILNSFVMLGIYLQQTTSADDIFRCIFFLGALRVSVHILCILLRFFLQLNVYLKWILCYCLSAYHSNYDKERICILTEPLLFSHMSENEPRHDISNILTSVDSDEPLQPPFKLRSSK